MELSREPQENEAEKIFIVKGTADQIAKVKEMIEQKVANAPDVPQRQHQSFRPSSPMQFSQPSMQFAQPSMFGMAQPYGGGMQMGYGGESLNV